ncbi:MAG: NDP-sugar synthase [Massilibacteroides sp.]|nr:NDP-sugar synthase [Massilibacteroides sp.]MDD3064487.1 NDP-sugar synthase [Massilibacteroides sp.]MDD4114978.1 NDP-sugar synthase [Massilibacteroides sp.]MDD4659912.1 NDP-sugar synthase [Massilibacteroides sp.]
MDYAIIAAGEGSRLVQEGIKCPKPLIRLQGTALIDRLIAIFMKNKASSIHIIVNEEMEEVQKHIKALARDLPINVLIKSTPSSMHSFYELSKFIRGDKFCLTTVDTIFQEIEFEEYIKTFIKEGSFDGLMAVTDFIDDEKPLYVNVNDEFTIHNFYDTNEKEYKYVSGGIYCLKQNAIGLLEKAIASGMFRMRNYQRYLIQEGLKLKAYPFSKIIDVDHAEDIQKAEYFLKTK